VTDRPWYVEGVVYDHDTADDAVHGLAHAAIGLSDALALLEADIPVVVEDWEGKARLVFDEQVPGVLEAGHQLVAALLTAGSSVMASYESAYQEAQLREELRAASEASDRVPVPGGRTVA